MPQTIKTSVIRILHYKEDSGWAVLSIESDGRSHRATGKFPGVKPGLSLELTGDFVTNRYGTAFQTESWREIRPSDSEGIRNYLASGLIKNIGPVFAEKIVQAFGEKTLDILDYEPERLKEIKGVGTKRINSVITTIKEQKEIRDIMIWLKRYDISNALATKIYKTYQGNAVPILEENPYRLSDDIKGIGFRKADQVAHLLGIPPDSPFRVRAGLRAVLEDQASEGNTCIDERQLVALTASPDYLHIDADYVQNILDDPLTDGITREQGRAWLNINYHSEKGIARKLLLLVRQNTDTHTDVDFNAIHEITGLDYSDEQKSAVLAVMENAVTILTGGPGTGKTATTNAVLAAAEQAGLKLLLAAPTGRAAKRMTEVTGRQAQTIHRLLEYGQEGFARNELFPLCGDLLVIDEISMVDTYLMSSLLKAVPKGMKLLLVGDADQLPSVGSGCILRDLIETSEQTGITVRHLTRIYRQAQQSAIVTNAHLINKGKAPYFPEQGGDMHFIPVEDRYEVAQTVADLVCRQIPQVDGIPHDGIQVLCPMRRSGDPIAAADLNKLLQERLNADGTVAARRPDTEFRIGDRIMQIKNDYDKELFNGDIGTVYRKLDPAVEQDKAEMAVLFDGTEKRFTQADLQNIELAYATTIHKSQGSEYPAVVMPIHDSHFIMLRRNLLYTGVTRAKKVCIIVGTRKAIMTAVSREDTNRRVTGLPIFIENLSPDKKTTNPCQTASDSQKKKSGGSEPNSNDSVPSTGSLFDEMP